MDSPRLSSARKPAESGFTLAEILIAASLMLFLGLGVMSAYLFLGRNFTRLGNTQQQDTKARRALFYFTQDVSSAISFTSTTTSNLTMSVPTTLGLANCATNAGSTTVTCISTTGLTTGLSLISLGAGIPAGATVSSITNATTFVMSAGATTTSTGLAVSAISTPATVTYLYDSSAGTLTRTANSIAITLLTDIDATATSPSNGFFYYNTAGTAVTTAVSVKSIEFTFTTKVGTANLGTQSSDKVVSPRVVVRNKQFLP
jgi:Tfp pilus assembly protein PilW